MKMLCTYVDNPTESQSHPTVDLKLNYYDDWDSWCSIIHPLHEIRWLTNHNSYFLISKMFRKAKSYKGLKVHHIFMCDMIMIT